MINLIECQWLYQFIKFVRPLSHWSNMQLAISNIQYAIFLLAFSHTGKNSVLATFHLTTMTKCRCSSNWTQKMSKFGIHPFLRIETLSIAPTSNKSRFTIVWAIYCVACDMCFYLLVTFWNKRYRIALIWDSWAILM